MPDPANGSPLHRMVGTENVSTYQMGDGRVQNDGKKWYEHFDNNAFSRYSQTRIMEKRDKNILDRDLHIIVLTCF